MINDRTLKLSSSSRKFITSKASLKAVLGPVGSGKTTTSLLTIIYHASQQPYLNGLRRSRCVVVRNTEPQLKSTVIASLIALFPSIKMNYGSPIKGILCFRCYDNTIAQIEFIFLATSIPKNEEKFLGLETTFIYINEGNKLLRTLFVAALDRHGRYPSSFEGGSNWHGIIIDCNAFPSTDWLYKDVFNGFDIATPASGDFIENNDRLLIRQPPALFEFQNEQEAVEYSNNQKKKHPDVDPSLFNPACSIDKYWYVLNIAAENLRVLSKGYYTKGVPFKSSRFIQLRMMNHFIDVNNDSMLCYPMFQPNGHITGTQFDISRSKMYLLGWDFGLDPSCAIIAIGIDDSFNVVGEISIHGVGVERAIPFVKRELERLLIPFNETITFMDPSGVTRSQSNEYRCRDALAHAGFKIGSQVSQNVLTRIEAVRELLYESSKFTVSSSCSMLIKGFLSTYHFKDTITKYEIEKNTKENHIHDALQYAALGYKDMNRIQSVIPNF